MQRMPSDGVLFIPGRIIIFLKQPSNPRLVLVVLKSPIV